MASLKDYLRQWGDEAEAMYNNPRCKLDMSFSHLDDYIKFYVDGKLAEWETERNGNGKTLEKKVNRG